MRWGMELTEPGFDHSVLSEFRDRLAEGDRADRLLAVMVDRLAEAGLVRARGCQRTDSTHVLAAVRRLSRVELVAETMRMALEALAQLDEVWLAGVMPAQWADRYGRSARHERQPTGAAAVRQYVEQVGADGMLLLQAVNGSTGPVGVRLPWRCYVRCGSSSSGMTSPERCGGGRRAVRARKSREGTTRRRRQEAVKEDAEPARVPWSSVEIVSPHDPEARFSHKPGKVEWVGYKDHQTETCDEAQPNLIVHVVTTPAPEQDIGVVGGIHAALAERQLAPAEHLVDSGYVTPETAHHALIDHVSPPWKQTMADRKPRLSALFRRADCRSCAVRQERIGNVDGKGRHLLLLPQPLQEIQTQARAQQQTPEWKQRYALRAGAEATGSETVHAHGLRHCRYRGLAKTHVQHVLTAAGTNIVRLSQHQPGSTSAAAKPSSATLPRIDRQLTPKITNSIQTLRQSHFSLSADTSVSG